LAVLSTNGPALPKSLDVLKPQQIRYRPYRYDPHNGDPVEVDVVEIKIFGMHSTGGHSTPYYGFEIVWGRAQTDIIQSWWRGSGNGHGSYREIAPNFYEVY